MDIAVGVIYRLTGEIFITQRPEGSHLAGYWDFPGGKIKQGETPEQALIRELYEEVDLHVLHTIFLKTVNHQYKDSTIALHVFWVDQWDGEPFAKEGQLSRWVNIQQLDADDFPAANRSIIEILKTDKPLSFYKMPSIEGELLVFLSGK